MKTPRKKEYEEGSAEKRWKERERSEYAKMEGVITYCSEVR